MVRELKRKPLDAANILDSMAEGNERAREILMEIQYDDLNGGREALLKLNDMNIRGVQVVAGRDYCGSVSVFISRIQRHDTDMIAAINKDSRCGQYKAVTGGSKTAYAAERHVTTPMKQSRPAPV